MCVYVKKIQSSFEKYLKTFLECFYIYTYILQWIMRREIEEVL